MKNTIKTLFFVGLLAVGYKLQSAQSNDPQKEAETQKLIHLMENDPAQFAVFLQEKQQAFTSKAQTHHAEKEEAQTEHEKIRKQLDAEEAEKQARFMQRLQADFLN